MGRTKKLDPATAAYVCNLVEQGKTIAEAARIVGCDQRTVYNLQQADLLFRDRVARARRQSPRHLRAARERHAESARLFERMLEQCRDVYRRSQDEGHRRFGVFLKALLGYGNMDEFQQQNQDEEHQTAETPRRRGRKNNHHGTKAQRTQGNANTR